MLIEIETSVADDPAAHRWLDRLLHKIGDGWHLWDVTGLERFSETTWICDRGRAGAWVSELFVAATRRSAWSGPGPHGRRLRVTNAPNGSEKLSPESAARLAEQPLVVLVENRVSDGHGFLGRVIHELDHDLRKLLKMSGEPLQFDSVGGKGQMVEEVTRKCASSQVRPRLVVMVDSDRKGPEEKPSLEAQRLKEKCEQQNLPCWILAKREAENYLPRPLLEARPDSGRDHAQRVEAWDRLSDDQKDYLDMKNGLPTKPQPAERKLFNELNKKDRDLLKTGFGRKVHHCWKNWSVSPKKELLKRGRGDLEHGLSLIRKEV